MDFISMWIFFHIDFISNDPDTCKSSNCGKNMLKNMRKFYFDAQFGPFRQW